MNLMLVFHRPEVLGGKLYFTTQRSPNVVDRGRWEAEGYRVMFVDVDPVAQTAIVLPVEA
jgi:hypothetical protein